MWWWEVIFETEDGNCHSLYSLQGFPDQRQAYDNLIAHDKDINEELQRRHSVLIIDEQIIFKKEKLY